MGMESRNGNDPWKMLDKGHHAIYRLDFTAQYFVALSVSFPSNDQNTLIEQSQECFINYPTLMACELIGYICHICNSCNMGMRAFPDMYARLPKGPGLRAYISGKARMPMLQLICNTYQADSCTG